MLPQRLEFPVNFTILGIKSDSIGCGTVSLMDNVGELYSAKIVQLDSFSSRGQSSNGYANTWLVYHELVASKQLNERSAEGSGYFATITRSYTSSDGHYLYLLSPEESPTISLDSPRVSLAIEEIAKREDLSSLLKFLAYQMLSGVGHLHASGNATALLSLNNFSTTDDFEVSLSSLGSEASYKFYKLYKQDACSPLSYDLELMTIEQLLNSNHSSAGATIIDPQAVDMWRLGCLLAQLALGEHAFVPQCRDVYRQMFSVAQGLELTLDEMRPIAQRSSSETAVPFVTQLAQELALATHKPQKLTDRLKARGLDDSLISLIMGLITVSQENRLTAQQALSHECFTADSDYEETLQQNTMVAKKVPVEGTLEPEAAVTADNCMRVLPSNSYSDPQRSAANRHMQALINEQAAQIKQIVAYNYHEYEERERFTYALTTADPAEFILNKEPAALAKFGHKNILRVLQQVKDLHKRQAIVFKVMSAAASSKALFSELLPDDEAFLWARNLLITENHSLGTSPVVSGDERTRSLVGWEQFSPSECTRDLIYFLLYSNNLNDTITWMQRGSQARIVSAALNKPSDEQQAVLLDVNRASASVLGFLYGAPKVEFSGTQDFIHELTRNNQKAIDSLDALESVRNYIASSAEAISLVQASPKYIHAFLRTMVSEQSYLESIITDDETLKQLQSTVSAATRDDSSSTALFLPQPSPSLITTLTSASSKAELLQQLFSQVSAAKKLSGSGHQ